MLLALDLRFASDFLSWSVIGRCPPRMLPRPNFLRARLPALVALKPPAEWPDMMLRLVSWVLVLLWVAEEEFVESVRFVLVVKFRLRRSPPSSAADF